MKIIKFCLLFFLLSFMNDSYSEKTIDVDIGKQLLETTRSNDVVLNKSVIITDYSFCQRTDVSQYDHPECFKYISDELFYPNVEKLYKFIPIILKSYEFKTATDLGYSIYNFT